MYRKRLEKKVKIKRRILLTHPRGIVLFWRIDLRPPRKKLMKSQGSPNLLIPRRGCQDSDRGVSEMATPHAIFAYPVFFGEG